MKTWWTSIYRRAAFIRCGWASSWTIRPGATALLAEGLRYTQSNGTIALRDAIAALYPGATRDHVQVTNGGSEANYITTWNLVEPGDDVVMMVRITCRRGASRAPSARRFASGRFWAQRRVGRRRRRPCARGRRARTKLIVICNPNNPTGARFDGRDLDRIVDVAAQHRTWLLADEIYRGAELDGRETPTIWGRYDRAIVTSGLSKAYGLPGLRIGWIVGRRRWSHRHGRITTTRPLRPARLSDALARHALEPHGARGFSRARAAS